MALECSLTQPLVENGSEGEAGGGADVARDVVWAELGADSAALST